MQKLHTKQSNCFKQPASQQHQSQEGREPGWLGKRLGKERAQKLQELCDVCPRPTLLFQGQLKHELYT